MANKKYVKVGKVLIKDGGPFIALGNNGSKDPKYNYSVELTIRDAEGKVVATKQNGFLSLLDPRKAPGMSDEARERIPQNLKFDISFAVKE